MRQSQVKPGARALLSLGRRGAVAVTVVRVHRASNRVGTSASAATWLVKDSSGGYHIATARRLQPLPVTDASGKLIGYAPRIESSEPGQTIDMGDSVIETTLHRLG
jgi:hypothetical protein